MLLSVSVLFVIIIMIISISISINYYYLVFYFICLGMSSVDKLYSVIDDETYFNNSNNNNNNNNARNVVHDASYFFLHPLQQIDISRHVLGSVGMPYIGARTMYDCKILQPKPRRTRGNHGKRDISDSSDDSSNESNDEYSNNDSTNR